MSNTFDQIPLYDPVVEQRGKPKLKPVEVQGVEVGRGENRKLVNPQIVWMMAELGCPEKEIAEYLGVSESTLKFNFSVYMAKARTHLHMKLRRAQLHNAIQNQNATMQIWLGKNMLGQTDNPLENNQPDILPWHSDDALEQVQEELLEDIVIDGYTEENNHEDARPTTHTTSNNQ